MKDIFDKCNFADLELNSRIIRTGLWQSQDIGEVYQKYDDIAGSGVGLMITNSYLSIQRISLVSIPLK